MSADVEPVAVTDSLFLADQLCFGLYAASRAVTGVYRQVLEDLDLTYPQYLVMLVLWEQEPRSVKSVMAALRLDYGTLTPLLKRLELAGLVERLRRTDDERVVEVRLTAAGRALHGQARRVPVEISHALGLTQAQVDALHLLLGTVTTNVAAHVVRSADRGEVAD